MELLDSMLGSVLNSQQGGGQGGGQQSGAGGLGTTGDLFGMLGGVL
jgi:hypothetical protein